MSKHSCTGANHTFFTDDVFEIGNLWLKPANRELVIYGAQIVLTKKEFDILSLLFRYAGKVHDRDTIKIEIWPDQKLYEWNRTLNHQTGKEP